MEEKKPMHYILKEESHVQGSFAIPDRYSISKIDERYISGLEDVKKTTDISELARIVAEEFIDTPISYHKPEAVPDFFIIGFYEGSAGQKVLVQYRELDGPERTQFRKGMVDAIEGYTHRDE